MIRRLCVALVCCAILCALNATAAPRFSMRPISPEGAEGWLIFPSVNNAGQVIASSLDVGMWEYDGATSQVLRLPDDYRAEDGSVSFMFASSRITDSGQVLLQGPFYKGNEIQGFGILLYDGTNYKDLGLFDSRHTGEDGSRVSYGFGLNEYGQATGVSARYEGDSWVGDSAWFYDGTTTSEIDPSGVIDLGGGASGSRAWLVNAHAQVTGESYSAQGQFAWLFDGGVITQLGVLDSEHTRDDGFRISGVYGINDHAQIVGSSSRYDGDTNRGQTGWLYDKGQYLTLGLTGDEFISNEEYINGPGYSFTWGLRLNESGQVIGKSRRYNADRSQAAAWFYDGDATIELGLVGDEYEIDGLPRSSYAVFLNDAGQVAGYTENSYADSFPRGQDAWLYDSSTGQTTRLRLSARSDGYAASIVHHLGEDGFVLGSYQLFNSMDDDLGQRAFYYTPLEGLHDLGSLVDGELSSYGVEYLYSDFMAANDRGQIVVQGYLTSSTPDNPRYRTFLLTRVVPEPTGVVLSLGWGALIACQRFSRDKGFKINRDQFNN